jgi:XTP/dITP diphosphohydrolase
MKIEVDPKPVLRGRGYVATGNAGKLKEIIPLCHEYFDIEGEVTGLAPEGAVESADTFEGNALIKARFLRDVLARRGEKAPFWILADDSGLSADDLDGRPGVHSARYAGDHVAPEAHMQKLVQEIKDSGRPAPHAAHYTCALALIEVQNTFGPTRESLGEGECHGEIVFTPRGGSGFGYDPVFFVPEFGKTFAEVTYDEKNSISHRRRAFETLRRALAGVVTVLTLVLALPSQAATMADVLLSWQNEDFLTLPQIPSNLPEPAAVGLDTSTLKPEEKKLLDLYLTKLPKKDGVLWKSLELSADQQLPSARPARRFFNTHLLQAFDGTRLLASFRPVDTTSGCDSGCAPITFHLMFTKDLALIQDPEHPLLKKGHAPLTSDDIKILAANLLHLPSLLLRVSSSAQSTDENEQTWPLFAKTLVPGAAYTSYRVYEAGFQTLETLRVAHTARLQALEESNEILGQAFRIEKPKEATALWNSLLNAKPSDVRLLEQTRNMVLAALVTWRFDSNPKADKKTLFADLKSARLQDFAPFKCRILETLVLAPETRSRLVTLNDAELAPCPSLSADWIQILAAPHLKDARLLKRLESDAPALPKFVTAKPELLEEVALKLPPEAMELRKELLSRLRAENPRYPLGANLFDSKRAQEIEAALRTETLSKLSTRLGSLPSAKLDKFEGATEFPVKGKEVYIFFASWCPHCRQLLEMLRDELKTDSLWKKIQLVESLSSSDSLFEAQMLCAQIKLQKKTCDEMLLLPSARRNPDLSRALHITAVPRVIITDASGKIRDFDFQFEVGPHQDPLRKLRWVLESKK